MQVCISKQLKVRHLSLKTKKSFLPLSIVLPEQSSYLLFFQEAPLVTSRRGVKSSLIGRDLPSLCNEGMTKY